MCISGLCRDVGKGCITAELIDPDELVAGIITRAWGHVPCPIALCPGLHSCVSSEQPSSQTAEALTCCEYALLMSLHRVGFRLEPQNTAIHPC